jgi:hypothetical protein
MSDVVTQLEKLFSEELALKGQRDELDDGKKGTKTSERSQTMVSGGFDGDKDEVEEEIRGSTWQGGRKGLINDDDDEPSRQVLALQVTSIDPFLEVLLR